jgi:hypothetical protein
MANLADKFKQYGRTFGRGLITEMVPGMAAGLIVDLFHEWNVNLASITSDIQNNRSLWGGLEEEQKQQLAFAARQIGNLDFITPEFFINAIKKDFPDLASLLLNWNMAGQWLQRQIDDMKTEIELINNEK